MPAGAPGTTTLAFVSFEGITKRYANVSVLRGVSGRFERGALHVLRGANGSGKSTLLGVLGTALRSDRGRICYGDVAELSWDDRSAVRVVRSLLGWVSHETLSYPDLSGRANLELAARLHGVDVRAAWEHARERFGLGAFAERPVRTYSRGQRQRIALARALVHGPSVLLLDEPTTGLDVDGVKLLDAAITAELDRGCVVVAVTHEAGAFANALSPAKRLRTWQLAAGRLEEV